MWEIGNDKPPFAPESILGLRRIADSLVENWICIDTSACGAMDCSEGIFTVSLNPLRFIPVTRLFISGLLSRRPREYHLLLDRLLWRFVRACTRCLLRVDRRLLHGNGTRRYRHSSLNESRLLLYRGDIRKAYPDDVVLLPDVAVQWFQSCNLRGHDERLSCDLKGVLLSAANQPSAARLFQTLKFHLADRVGNPFCRVCFGGLEKYLCRGLREDDFGVLAVTLFKLASALESEHNRVAGFAALRDDSMELRQLVQAGQFIQHKPHRLRRIHTGRQHAENQHIKPYAMQRQ